MKAVNDLKMCCGCGACESICPKDCISLNKDWEGFYYPDIDIRDCIGCHSCEKVCPMINDVYKASGIACFAVINKDGEVRS